MKKRTLQGHNNIFSLISVFLINVSLLSHTFCMDNENNADIEKLKVLDKKFRDVEESFLTDNKELMTKESEELYRVNDSQFNHIFSPCYFSLGDNVINNSVGLIRNRYDDYDQNDILKLNPIKKTSSGTGTIIKNTTGDITIITSAHVVAKKGSISFTLGSCHLMPGNNEVTYLAEYIEDKVFLHNSKDIAYVELKLKENKLDKEKLGAYSMEISHEPINTKEKVQIYHYPFGIETQKINEGYVLIGNNNHTMPTLGGSSGAPIILNGKIMGIHTGGGEVYGKAKAEFRGYILDFTVNNVYIRMSDTNLNPSDFEERR